MDNSTKLARQLSLPLSALVANSTFRLQIQDKIKLSVIGDMTGAIELCGFLWVYCGYRATQRSQFGVEDSSRVFSLSLCKLSRVVESCWVCECNEAQDGHVI